MFLLVFVVLLGTVVTVNSAQPDVELFSEVVDVGAETDSHRLLVCRAKAFKTTDIILNIKKKRCVQTKEDGVETSGVKPDDDKTFSRIDHVIIPPSIVSDYSCEVSHAASRFRVEKVWDPDFDGGRIISSKFIDTTPPDVFVFPKNSTVPTNIILTCLVSGFYPNNITLNMKRNGRILTGEDGVKSSRVCSNEVDTFQRRDSVEIKKSDKSDFSCEVSHAASGSRVEKFWDQRAPPPPPHSDGDKTGVIIGPVVGVLLLVVVLVVVLRRRRILGIPLRAMVSTRASTATEQDNYSISELSTSSHQI
ncbi:uncharacterized protein LOC125019940 [Mugil cephalus]|uniref:uncharacterized protein LOC125019940 n=1 Tax=Mugil cephalus TaxID=48193 RepID=UPI001FB85B70|nr:uncharacterized protein LOC125019940 [Mugil cephalus]